MARLIYSGIISLDGYLDDADGGFDWSAPGEEVHDFVNDLERRVGTYLFGRRMYEVLAVWERMPGLDAEPQVMRDFAALWAAADKVVYSTTLTSVHTARTRIERSFDPVAVAAMVRSADRDVGIGGASIASHAIAAGLVDEYRMFLNPVLVGGGTRFLPHGVNLELELVDERRFADGVVYLAYRPR